MCGYKVLPAPIPNGYPYGHTRWVAIGLTNSMQFHQGVLILDLKYVQLNLHDLEPTGNFVKEECLNHWKFCYESNYAYRIPLNQMRH